MKIKTTHLKKSIACAVLCIIVYSCGEPSKIKQPDTPAIIGAKPTPIIPYILVNTFGHDTTAFIEGFLFHNNQLLESTGDTEYLPETRSTFGVVNLEKGTLDVKVEIDKTLYFGEGIVVLNNKLYQVTYQNQVGFIYDATTFKKIGQFNYPNKEGWGLTTDGKNIIMSDGTYNLTYLDPNDQKVVKTLAVKEGGYGLDHLNELEYIKGFIYANVWMTNYIVKINPENGEVVGKIELDDLNVRSRAKRPRCLEMNGIAYDSQTDKILVTGKMWPNIFEISFPH